MTPVVIDLGKKTKKQIGKLKAGGGKVLRQIDRTMDALRAGGASADAQALVLVVEEKRPKKKARKLTLRKGAALAGLRLLARRRIFRRAGALAGRVAGLRRVRRLRRMRVALRVAGRGVRRFAMRAARRR